ncbi:fimbria/pilus periplasmic chaperone [Vibrio sp. nBUS_14]|uniref:fimbria/pilus periplasmic chaperone n=1 Tax=Vibrio sp. nBUS_14 TaxID=3395321 RepID=UPI003EBCD1DA
MNKYSFLIASILIIFSFSSHASLVLDSTRYIFNQDEESISALIVNESTDDFGAQIWVDNISSTDSSPSFISSPSFFKIKGKSRQVVRIINISDEISDQEETVFWLNLQEIPKKKKGSGISLAIKTKVKLIYRPKSIRDGRVNAESELSIQHLPGSKILVNETPYVFAIGNLYDENDEIVTLNQESTKKLSLFLPGDFVDITGLNIKHLNAIDDLGGVEKYELADGE